MPRQQHDPTSDGPAICSVGLTRVMADNDAQKIKGPFGPVIVYTGSQYTYSNLMERGWEWRGGNGVLWRGWGLHLLPLQLLPVC